MQVINEKEKAKIKLMVETGDIPRLLAMGFYSAEFKKNECSLQGRPKDLGFVGERLQRNKMYFTSHIDCALYPWGITVVVENKIEGADIENKNKEDGQNND